MKHVFYFPASYAALFYSIIACNGLLLCLFIGVVNHSKTLLENSCGPMHYEYWPSISSAIGDLLPERQFWRISFALFILFFVGTRAAMFSVFWQKTSHGTADLRALQHSPRKLFCSSAFLCLLMLCFDVLRLISAFVWTMVSSRESLTYHNLGFVPYIFLCFFFQVTLVTLVFRNRFNWGLYHSHRDAQLSLLFKGIFMALETVAGIGVIVFYIHHKSTCKPGSYSRSTICEWVFALSNIIFDATAWWDLKGGEGWWLSGSPEFYKQLMHGDTSFVNGSMKPAVGGQGITADVQDVIVAGNTGDVAVGSFRPRHLTDEEHADSGDRNLTAIPTSCSSAADGTKMGLLNTEASYTSVGVSSVLSREGTESEFFLSPDVVLHRFTFCSAPSLLQLWLCDIYWAYLLFEMLVNLVEHIYFPPLVAMSLTWEMVSFAALGTPCLLRIPGLRRLFIGPVPLIGSLVKRSVPMYVLFYFLASFSHLHFLIQTNVGQKILAVAYGPVCLFLAMTIRYLYPTTATQHCYSGEDCRRMIYSFPLGLVLGMLLRILYVGLSPMFVNSPFAAVIGIDLGIVFTVCIYRQVMFGSSIRESMSHCISSQVPSTVSNSLTANTAQSNAEKENASLDAAMSSVDLIGNENIHDTAMRGRKVQFTVDAKINAVESESVNTFAALAKSYPSPPEPLLGCLMGLLIAMSLTFYTSANHIPRLLAVEPYPANLAVVAFFAFGIFLSEDVMPIYPQAMKSPLRLGILRRGLQGIFRASWKRFGAVLMLGVCLMLFATYQSNLTYELPHKSETKETPSIKHWRVQKDFRGNKYVAFVGGLIMTFCIGALYPVVMEVCYVHPLARRLSLLTTGTEVGASYKRDNLFLLSAELWSFVSSLFICVLYAVCISYPFVPMGWLMREKTRPVIFWHAFVLWLLAWMMVRRVRNAKKPLIATQSDLGRKQRSLHLVIALFIVFGFLIVVIGRTALQPEDASYPANMRTALVYPDEVTCIHEELVNLYKERNALTDSWWPKHKIEYQRQETEQKIKKLKEDVMHNSVSRCDLGALSETHRGDVWAASRAMSFFTGLIWTVHFGLDNFNVDSLERMVEQIRETGAGVIGLLETDTLHLTNGNRDMVEFVSYYLGYRYTDYGPTAIDNTFGCALISRYPIVQVHRYIMPSPMGELSCTIHAVLDVYGVQIHTYVGHFGNTEHTDDRLLQSQLLGELARNNPGPSLWLGYLVTFPGDATHYGEYTHPSKRGLFRDAGLELYVRRPWVRLKERGGYDEVPVTQIAFDPRFIEFNVDYKIRLPGVSELEAPIKDPDESFRRTPSYEEPRHFYFNQTNRYSTSHPRNEFIDRYCQYILYKTGAAADELPENLDKLQMYEIELFDWWRKLDGGVEILSDTEFQLVQLRFKKRVPIEKKEESK